MSVINGGLVQGMSTKAEYDFISRKNRHRLIQHRAKHFYHLFDRLVMICPEIEEVLSYVRSHVSKNWSKTIRGRVIGLMLIRYTDFLINPQQYSHRMDLIFFANYVMIQGYLQRLVKVLILNYDLPNRYYKFKIPKDKLFKLSELWAADMYDTVKNKLVPHYKKLHN